MLISQRHLLLLGGSMAIFPCKAFAFHLSPIPITSSKAIARVQSHQSTIRDDIEPKDPPQATPTVKIPPFPESAFTPTDTPINDPCAFEAASEEITSVIASQGSITEKEIQRIVHDCKDFANMIREYFPGAMGSSQVLQKIQQIAPLYGITVDNTLFSQSVCPDEINHERGDITNIFTQWLSNKVFHLGGLAAIPFTGPTGFAAYSGHVPEDGHCFILQAPHIGITRDGVLGKYCRVGQPKAGAACGAAIGAFEHCCAGKPLPDMTDANAMDQQMSWIIHQVSKKVDKIKRQPTDNHKQAMLVQEMQSMGKGRLDATTNLNFGGPHSCLFVLSGITINMPYPFEDYFEPLSFEMHKKDGSVRDLFPETFSGTGIDKSKSDSALLP